MARLTNAEGATVSVSDEKAERLVKQGWTLADEPKKATAKKASAKKATSSTTKKS